FTRTSQPGGSNWRFFLHSLLREQEDVEFHTSCRSSRWNSKKARTGSAPESDPKVDRQPQGESLHQDLLARKSHKPKRVRFRATEVFVIQVVGLVLTFFFFCAASPTPLSR